MISDPSLGDTVFVLQTTGYVKSVDFHARGGTGSIRSDYS